MADTTTTTTTALDALMAEVDAKSKQLKEQYKSEIHPFIFKGDNGEDDYVVGYLQEPSRQAKLSLLDRIYVGAAMTAAADILDVCLIQEASDPRILSDDKYYTGACKQVNNLVLVAVDFYKKK